MDRPVGGEEGLGLALEGRLGQDRGALPFAARDPVVAEAPGATTTGFALLPDLEGDRALARR